ncbi:rab-GTPase-TBC domain-containing protein [Syncephalis fuscata]|nr:rab-GTPase-TBC domain-containing protein [Syncephalis fuscata]
MPSANTATGTQRTGHTKRRSKQGSSGDGLGSRSNSQRNGQDEDPSQVERDQYGFRKGNQYLSLEDIHRFENDYEQTVQRRREKWANLLKDCEEGQLPPLSSKVKRFIRKGIPAHIRGQCWLHYSGAADTMKRNQGRYHQLVALSSDRKYREYRDLIERDLHRTFPENIQFTAAATRTPSNITSRFRQLPASSSVPVLQQLRRVLTAFAVRCPSVGYCQSLNYVAGLLLLFMSEEEAFWMLCTVVEQIMPEGMYGVKMEGVTVDQEVLMQLLEERMPSIYYRMNRDEDEVGAPPVTFVTSHWFLTLFVDVLPVESNLRVWDCLFLEGSEVLFRVALTLFKMHEQQICNIDDSLELFQYLQNMPKRMVDCHILMENCFRKYASLSHVSAKELERRRKVARDMTRRRVSNATNVPETIPKRNNNGHDFGSFFRN